MITKKKNRPNIGRPSKLTRQWLDAASKLDISFVSFTDIELIEAINERVAEKRRISLRTFKAWKQELNQSNKGNLSELEIEFLHLVSRFQRMQKKILYKKLTTDKHWRKWAWVIKRKFKRDNFLMDSSNNL